MLREHLKTHRGLLASCDVDQSQDPAVRRSADNSQFAEVLVQRHKDSSLGMSASQDLLVARVFGPITRPNNIMTGRGQFRESTAPNARIEQDLHGRIPLAGLPRFSTRRHCLVVRAPRSMGEGKRVQAPSCQNRASGRQLRPQSLKL
jgi:hypothetical protein